MRKNPQRRLNIPGIIKKPTIQIKIALRLLTLQLIQNILKMPPCHAVHLLRKLEKIRRMLHRLMPELLLHQTYRLLVFISQQPDHRIPLREHG